MTNDCLNSSFLVSPDFLVTFYHYLTLIEIPILSFGGYCILFKTPPQMSSVKWLMMNLHFWSALSDLLISYLGIPYVLLPAMAGWGLGAVESPRLLLYCVITLLAASCASVLAVYENRYHVLFGQNTWWSRRRRRVLFVVYCMIPFIFAPPYLLEPDQESARRYVRESLPCGYPEVLHDRPMYVLSLSITVPFGCVFTGVLVLSALLMTFVMLILRNLVYRKMTSASMKTQKMQRTFAVSFVFQTLFLISILFLPCIVALVVIVTWYHNQTLNSVLFIVFSIHGAGSTIVMIVVHKPYRDFSVSILTCSCRKRTPSAIIGTFVI